MTDPAAKLRGKVKAAVEEFDVAVAYHETWRHAARDTALHARVSHSFAGQTFLVIRSALRRETFLALARLWDNDNRAVGMASVAHDLNDKAIMNALCPASGAIADDLRRGAKEAIQLIGKYLTGSGSPTLTKIKKIRNEHLAHHQIIRKSIVISNIDQDNLDKEVDIFYDDMSDLVKLLLRVVERSAYNPKETAAVYAHYGNFFWASVRGERTEGHPNFRPPI